MGRLRAFFLSSRATISPCQFVFWVSALMVLASAAVGHAHRSGCHRWHSCPSDTGSYVCGDLGYYEDHGGLTCRNCTAPVNKASLGQPGGCNPIPLSSQVSGGELTIAEQELRTEAHIFPAAR